MTWAQLAVGLVSGLMVLAGTVVSSRMSARVGEKAAEVDQESNRTVDWNLFTQRLEAWTERQLKEQDDRTEQQLKERDKRIDRLEDTVRDLQAENELTRTKYWKAIIYGRAWRLQHPESVSLIDVPPEIAPDL